MNNKLAFFDGMSPEQKGALIGSLLGAGVGGIGGAVGSKKNKLRNSILAALAGGAGGAGLGYLGGRMFAPNPIADAAKKIAPEAAKLTNDPAGYALNTGLGAAGEGLKAIDKAKTDAADFGKALVDPVIGFAQKARDKAKALINESKPAPAVSESEAMGEEAISGPMKGEDSAPVGSDGSLFKQLQNQIPFDLGYGPRQRTKVPPPASQLPAF
jgi:hypothetical protein